MVNANVITDASMPRRDSSAPAAGRALAYGGWSDKPGLIGALCTVDHKRVGRRFIATAFVFFLLGGLLAVAMRLQLARPESTLIGPDLYNQLFTVHGTSMRTASTGAIAGSRASATSAWMVRASTRRKFVSMRVRRWDERSGAFGLDRVCQSEHDGHQGLGYRPREIANR